MLFLLETMCMYLFNTYVMHLLSGNIRDKFLYVL